jgi:hypothetical protein
MSKKILLIILISITNQFMIQFNKANERRCFIYRSENKQIDIIYKILNDESKDQIDTALYNLDTDEKIEFQNEILSKNNKINHIMLNLDKNYKFCFVINFIIDPVTVEINWKFLEKIADKKQLNKTLVLTNRLEEQSRILNVKLESDYFLLKNKFKNFKSSKNYLSYVTIFKVFLIIVVSCSQVVLILKAMKHQKYSNI